jgi:hypothetical protein
MLSKRSEISPPTITIAKGRVAFQRLPKGIVGQNRGGWHFALADFAEGLSSSH